MIQKLLFFFLVILLSLTSLQVYSSPLFDEFKVNELSQSPKWKRLLHWSRNYALPDRGEADGSEFYLSSKGQKSLQAELRATLEGFFSPPGEDVNKHALCRFPARFAWLDKQFNFDRTALPTVTCPKFDEFRNYQKIQGASLVFSSYYLESPASAFGHTLLRLHRKDGRGAELLDTGISFGATVTTENALLYAFMGIVGLFKGEFISIPYFYKVREYNDFESRDLWSYELNLSQEQLDELVAHLWELGQTYFDYYYFTENCSYLLLTILETLNPDWDLVSQLPPWVIPAETVKAVNRIPGLVKAVQYRPSMRKVFDQKFNVLNSSEKKIFFNLVQNPDKNSVEELDNSESSSRVLDSVLDYYDYKYPHELLTKEGGKPSERKIQKDLFLSKRSENSHVMKFQEQQLPNKERPDFGHPPLRFGLGHRDWENQNSSQLFNLRFAMHDLLDPVVGQPKSAILEFANITYEFNKKAENARFEDITIVNVMTLNPWKSYRKSISLRGNFGFTREKFTPQEHLVPNFQVGVGGAGEWFENYFLAFFLEAEGMVHKDIHKNAFNLFTGPSVLFLNRYHEHFLGTIKYSHLWPFPTKHSRKDLTIEHRLNWSNAWALGIKNSHQDWRSLTAWRHEASLYFYY
jgi:hypothetical protein